MKVLVIEDEEDVQAILKLALQSLGGHEVLTAGNGIVGLERARHESPDVILLDVMMPQMDGFEVIRTLKANERTREIPVIFLTAKAQEQERRRGIESGAIGYLTKPFYAMTLADEVETLLAQVRSGGATE